MSDFIGSLELNDYDNHIIHNINQYNQSTIEYIAEKNDKAEGYSGYQVAVSFISFSIMFVSVVGIIRCCFCGNNFGYTTIPDLEREDGNYGVNGMIFTQR